MNVDEHGHRTLSYQLVERLQERGKVHSMVLFTGTPHRGKDTGFLSLLKLLRPEDFDPEQPLEEQIEKLRTVMIRNNKTLRHGHVGCAAVHSGAVKARDVHLLTTGGAVSTRQLTQFIMTGRAYAAGLRFQGSTHGDPDPDHDAEARVEFCGSSKASSRSTARPTP